MWTVPYSVICRWLLDKTWVKDKCDKQLCTVCLTVASSELDKPYHITTKTSYQYFWQIHAWPQTLSTRLMPFSSTNVIKISSGDDHNSTTHLCSSHYIHRWLKRSRGITSTLCETSSTWWIQFRYNIIYYLNHSESSGTI